MKIFMEHILRLKQTASRSKAVLWLILDLMSVAVFAIGIATIVGYVINVTALYEGWVVSSPAMSVQTAICCSFVGAVLLMMRRHSGEN